MQGQKSPVRTLSENFVFDNVSASNDAAIDSPMSWSVFQAPPENRRPEYLIPSSDENVTYLQHARREGKNAEWAFGESSSSASQGHVESDERKLDHTWRALCFRELPYEEQGQHYELSRIPPLDAADLIASDNQRTNRASILHTSSSDVFPQDLNITAGFQDPKEDGCRIADHRSAFRTIGSSNGRPNGRSSDSFELLSGYGGFVMEEGIDGPGSLDPRRMPCKRKAIEVQMGQASGVGSSHCSNSAEISQWRTPQSAEVPANAISLSLPTDGDIMTNNGSDRVNSRVRIGAGGAVSAGHLFLSASENVDSSSRNSRLSTHGLHLHDPESGNPFLTETDVGSVNVPSSRHSSRLALRNYLLDLSPAPGLENGSIPGQSLLPAPPVRTNHQSRWSRASSRRTSNSSTSANSGGRNGSAFEDMASRNAPRSIAEHPMFVPGSEIGNSVENPTNWDLASRNHSLGGNVGSTSRASSSTGAHSGPSWSYRSGSQYRQRLQDMIRRSLLSSSSESGGPSSDNAMQASSSASQELEIPSGQTGPDNHRLRAFSSRSALLERHVDTASGVPYSLRTLAAAGEGRRSVMSEIRHVLDLMRRGEGLRFEDMMILDHSVLFGMPDVHDRHRDMRMDVDNMSYEELLALEERIGNVCTGLSEETIISQLKKWKFVENKGVDGVEKEPCSICREEYNAGEDLGELKCGHDFHTNCIKQWLMVKNLCPICKTAGLHTL